MGKIFVVILLCLQVSKVQRIVQQQYSFPRVVQWSIEMSLLCLCTTLATKRMAAKSEDLLSRDLQAWN